MFLRLSHISISMWNFCTVFVWSLWDEVCLPKHNVFRDGSEDGSNTRRTIYLSSAIGRIRVACGPPPGGSPIQQYSSLQPKRSGKQTAHWVLPVTYQARNASRCLPASCHHATPCRDNASDPVHEATYVKQPWCSAGVSRFLAMFR